jgi:hypothetical protein
MDDDDDDNYMFGWNDGARTRTATLALMRPLGSKDGNHPAVLVLVLKGMPRAYDHHTFTQIIKWKREEKRIDC